MHRAPWPGRSARGGETLAARAWESPLLRKWRSPCARLRPAGSADGHPSTYNSGAATRPDARRDPNKARGNHVAPSNSPLCGKTTRWCSFRTHSHWIFSPLSGSPAIDHMSNSARKHLGAGVSTAKTAIPKGDGKQLVTCPLDGGEDAPAGINCQGVC